MLIDLECTISIERYTIGSITVDAIFQWPLTASAGRLRWIHRANGACKIQLRIDILCQCMQRDCDGVLLSLLSLTRYFWFTAATWGLILDTSKQTIINVGSGWGRVLL